MRLATSGTRSHRSRSRSMTDSVRAGWRSEAWIARADGPIAGIEVAQADVSRAPVDPAAAKGAAASINAFGLDLLRAMLADGTMKADQNAVFSPTSIALALAMARAAANGETAP